MGSKWLKMVFLDKSAKKAKKGKKSWKMIKIWPKMVIFDVFWKSSKKNFNFALIRPFFWGVHRPWKWGSIFAPFGSRPYENLYYVYRFAYYLVTPFFSGPGGPPGGPPKIDTFVFFVFLAIFGDFWCFLVIFGCFWCFWHFWWFWCFLVIFGCFWCFWWN